MLLREILDEPYEWKWHRKGGYEWLATFAKPPKEGQGPRREDSYIVQIEMDEVGVWEIAFGDAAGRQGITKSGDSFKIFATVLDIVKDFVKTNKPEWIRFSAKEMSRDRLYRSLVKRYAPKIGYTLPYVSRDKDGPRADDIATEFMLKRK